MASNSNNNKDLRVPKNLLIVGSGGRENSLAWAISKCGGIDSIFIAPGNAGSNFSLCKGLEISESSSHDLLKICKEKSIDLVIIGAERPLADGLADFLRGNNISVFGPGADGARIESSKRWAKELMKEANIPTANYWTTNNKQEAFEIIKKVNKPLVVKADGLAAGKGVAVCNSILETKNAIEEVFDGKFGEAGKNILLEEILHGPEISIFGLCDGERIILLPPSQDHKRLLEDDKGPNTGGMGAYAPAKIISNETLSIIKEEIMEATLEALKKRGINYRGVIYAGLMLTQAGPKVIEFNCRFGDPECQAIMPLLGEEISLVLQSCADGCLDSAPELSIKKSASACVVAVAEGYPENPRKGDKIKLPLIDDNLIQLFHSGTKISNNGDFITSGGRVISVAAQAKTFDLAFQKTYETLKKIEYNGIKYRNDIGYQVRRHRETT